MVVQLLKYNQLNLSIEILFIFFKLNANLMSNAGFS